MAEQINSSSTSTDEGVNSNIHEATPEEVAQLFETHQVFPNVKFCASHSRLPAEHFYAGASPNLYVNCELEQLKSTVECLCDTARERSKTGSIVAVTLGGVFALSLVALHVTWLVTSIYRNVV